MIVYYFRRKNNPNSILAGLNLNDKTGTEYTVCTNMCRKPYVTTDIDRAKAICDRHSELEYVPLVEEQPPAPVVERKYVIELEPMTRCTSIEIIDVENIRLNFVRGNTPIVLSDEVSDLIARESSKLRRVRTGSSGCRFSTRRNEPSIQLTVYTHCVELLCKELNLTVPQPPVKVYALRSKITGKMVTGCSNSISNQLPEFVCGKSPMTTQAAFSKLWLERYNLEVVTLREERE